LEASAKVNWPRCCSAFLLLLLIFTHYLPMAGELTIRPSVVVNEIISDNINLASDNERKEYVTQLIPAIAIAREGSALSLGIDYAWENLRYAKESSRNTSYNRLRANATWEVEENTFFLDATGSIRQQVINNQNRLIIDNINPATRGDIKTFTAGPRLQNHLGSFADSKVVFMFGKVSNSNTNQVTDSDILNLDAGIVSGSRFSAVQWNANYSVNETRRSVGNKTKLESVTGDVRGRSSYRINWLFRGGFINDSIQGLRGINTGYFFSAGLVWTPSSNLTVDGTYGNNNEDFNLEYRPTQRTSVLLSYRNRDLGTNPGSRWSGVFRHATRFFSWDVMYAEDTTNLQSLEFSSGGAPTLINVGGGLVDRNSLIFSTTDEDFVRKIFQFTFALTRAKSTLQISGGGERRDFLDGDEQDKFVNGNVLWDWRVTARSNLIVNGGFINRHFGSSEVDDNNWYGGLSITRRFLSDVNGQVAFRHIERNASGGNNVDYQENRLNIGVEVGF